MSNEHAIILTDGYGIVRYQPKCADLGVSPICKVVACQGECQPLPKIMLITYTFHSRSFREGVKKNCEKAIRLTAGVDPLPSPKAVRKM